MASFVVERGNQNDTCPNEVGWDRRSICLKYRHHSNVHAQRNWNGLCDDVERERENLLLQFNHET